MLRVEPVHMKSKKPNFFIVGAAKSGTTSLADYIGQHPSVYMSPVKEPFFFVEDYGWSNEAEYLDLFSDVTNENAIGEASTGYLYDKGAASRIFNFSPEAKIIIILRNPIDMAYSYWKFMSLVGNEKLSFEDAIDINEQEFRFTSHFKEQAVNWWASYIYLDRAMYANQVKNYIQVFGESRVKLLIFEEFISDPIRLCRDVFEFLGVDNTFIPVMKKLNEGGEMRFKKLPFHRIDFAPRLRRILRKLLPAPAREKVRLFLRKLNTKPSNQSKINDLTKQMLVKFFKPDVENLQNSFCIDLKKYWNDFF